MPRLSHFQSGAAIARQEPFQSNTGSLRGIKGGPSTHGVLPRGHSEELSKANPDYTVMSYATPIAYHAGGKWHYPDVSYSATTSKHQSITRKAIGVKSERDVKMEQRAKRREEKRKKAAEETEKGLWES